MNLRIQRASAQNRKRVNTWRSKRRENGDAHLRLLVTQETHTQLHALKKKYKLGSLAELLSQYLEFAQARVDVCTLPMPARRSKTEKLREVNALISTAEIAVLDGIKDRHGLSRYYALDALLAVMPDPWADAAQINFSNGKTDEENAVSG